LAIVIDYRKLLSMLTALKIERLVWGAVDVDDLAWF
jgi:hypothetical protein